MAQYAVLIYHHDSAHAPDSTPEDRESCDSHSDELTGSGAMVAAYALTPRAMGTSPRGDTVTDGPFIDSKEIVVGFYIIEAPDLDAALEIARTNPSAWAGGAVEVRPLHTGRSKPAENTPSRPVRTTTARSAAARSRAAPISVSNATDSAFTVPSSTVIVATESRSW